MRGVRSQKSGVRIAQIAVWRYSDTRLLTPDF
jgi:hypothetical protein